MNQTIQMPIDVEYLVTQLTNMPNSPEAHHRDLLESFSRGFYSRYTLEDLSGRYLTDVYGVCQHLLSILKESVELTPQVSAFNPTLDGNGWANPHTLLVIHQKDMPFLVDSVRIELNKRNIAIHTIKSTVFTCGRDNNHQLSDLNVAQRDPSLTYGMEALLYFEINTISQESELADLVAELQQILLDITTTVQDYGAMLGAVTNLEKHLPISQEESKAMGIGEAREFLRWMQHNHFTFLGYAEYDFFDKNGVKYIRENTAKRLGLFKSRGSASEPIPVDAMNPGMARFYVTPQAILFTKSSVRSRVHRQAYSDYVLVKRYDESGHAIGEARIMGLYTSNVYTMNPFDIPIIRQKVEKVVKLSDVDLNGYYGKNLIQVINNFPRDELFQSSSTELYDTLVQVAQINERYKVRLFVRKDPFGKFLACIIYIPKDVFNTQMRLQIQGLIAKEIHSDECEFNTHFSESILARVYLVFKLKQGVPYEINAERLEQKIRDISHSWDDHLHSSLLDFYGEEHAQTLWHEFRNAFSISYREQFDTRTCVHDIASLLDLKDANDINLSFYQPLGVGKDTVKFKIYRRESPVTLSQVVPILESMGLQVHSETPYSIKSRAGIEYWLHEFVLTFTLDCPVDILTAKELFQKAFVKIWFKEVVSDEFNKLVLSAGIPWYHVVLLRLYSGYMKQTLFNFPETFIANCLVKHPDVSQLLLTYFDSKFNPTIEGDRQALLGGVEEQLSAAMDTVSNLAEDRVLRRYFQLIKNTLRTNYYIGAHNEPKPFISIKLSPRQIPDIPEPRPLYEIYVYSMRTEGVHLRGGKVARGGIRWSDRLQDYRTEVLGLVKAQQVKNAVIVPNGAKGGFICKQAPVQGGREALLNDAIECYKIFISGLLDLTDNIRSGQLTKPSNVLCYDEDDPYLVVAADKGTATFSDIANSLSKAYEFWLGDAFASGGSQGYDHKGMGITARGAWISVARHFKEKGVNIQTDDFTVVGIGDMAGDVFGNGMLLSQHICLVGAFNHAHIFIDPTPNSAESFVERKRLFNLPKSTWADYNADLISAGGGIFGRDLKSISITPEMKLCFDIIEDSLSPNELINRLLKAPVDLIWNGGIGTYVKSSAETDAGVGDKTNDSLRVNGKDLRCRVFGEGGNLGMTQRGRVEYCLQGGACNTDFIDNAGGVDCSDHEVNIKILVNSLVARGDMTEKQRNTLLSDMTHNVAALVLENNYRQTWAISIAEAETLARAAEYRRFISTMESSKRLNRALEFIPTDEELIDRHTHGVGLSRPELAILISYAKAMLKDELAVQRIDNDAYLRKEMLTAFPDKIISHYETDLLEHPLKPEIVATQVANDMVNNMGISFAARLIESTGATIGTIARAYVTARDVYDMKQVRESLSQQDYKISSSIQNELMINLMRKVRRATRWFLRNRRGNLDPQLEINYFQGAIKEVHEHLLVHLPENERNDIHSQEQVMLNAMVPESLVEQGVLIPYLFSGLSIAEAARLSDKPIGTVTQLYILVANTLSLSWFSQQLSNIKVDNFWQAMARETYMDDLESQLRNITIALLKELPDGASVEDLIAQWADFQYSLIARWKLMITELQAGTGADFAVFSVALRDLLDLCQATQHLSMSTR